jgi:ankyrin repeat protein
MLRLYFSAGMTPALLAARNNHRRFLKVIVEEYHAKLNIADCSGSTIVHWLACNGRTELLKYTLTFKINVDIDDNLGQVTFCSLHRFVCINSTSHARVILLRIDCA